MLTLGLDTALSSCSVALLRDGRVIAASARPLEKGHAEHLAPMARDVLAEAGVHARDLDRVGVVVGPGGFAGVRVGVAFARGLALGTRLKAVGVASLAALARGAFGTGRIAAVVNAHRGEVYAALYDETGTLIEPFAAAPETALSRLLGFNERVDGRSVLGRSRAIGDGVPLIDPKAEHFDWLGAPAIDAAVVARLAAAAPEPTAPPSPLYLRDPDARPSAPSAFAALLYGEGAP
jgi:tRNA threonylcarbamoyladenosine biosynthesis protein TsaB